VKQSKKFLCGFFAAASLLMTSVSVMAQSYPTKPIRIVFPFAPGGGGDFVARFIAQRLSETLRQNVYVENRPGAGGLTGSDMAIREPADGYTLLLISNSYTVNPSIYNVKFDPVTGITPIARISEGPLLIVANPSFKPSTTRELIAAAKAAPGKLNFASGGMGSAVHLASERFGSMADIKMTHVPYKSTGQAVTDVIGGQVDLVFSSTASSLAHVNSGKLKPIAVTGMKRLDSLPNVPTVNESGLPGYDMILWHGLIGPKNMPPEIVARLNEAIQKILKMPETAQRLESEGVVPAVDGTPAKFEALIKAEVGIWAKVAAAAGIKKPE